LNLTSLPTLVFVDEVPNRRHIVAKVATVSETAGQSGAMAYYHVSSDIGRHLQIAVSPEDASLSNDHVVAAIEVLTCLDAEIDDGSAAYDAALTNHRWQLAPVVEIVQRQHPAA